MKIAQGETQQFIATAIYTGGRSLDITTDTNTRWLTGRADIAVIDPLTGIATGKSQGTANIAVSYNNKTYPYVPLTVTPPKMTITMTFNPANPNVYDNVYFTTTGTYSDTSIPSVDLTHKANYNTSDVLVAGITNAYPFISHEFQVLKAGTASITATWTTPYGENATGTTPITVSGDTNACNKTYVQYRQNTTELGSIAYDHDPFIVDAQHLKYAPDIYENSMGAVGCHVAVAAMVLSTLGDNITPKELNEWLNTKNTGWVSSGNGPNWALMKNRPLVKSKITTITEEKDFNTAEIDGYLKNCNMVIAVVGGKWNTTTNKQSFPWHYVLIISGSNGNYKIYDPWLRTGAASVEDITTNYVEFKKYIGITLSK